MSEPSPQSRPQVVVTGGGSGIGRALALEVRRRGGQEVLVVDRNPEGAEETARLVGSSAAAIVLDVTDENAVADFVASVERDRGPIATWFSNAGVSRGAGLGSEDDWRTSLEVNLLAHVRAARAVLPRMERRGGGRFVVTASAAGLLSDPRSAPYSASKHALVGLAEWLAIGAADGVSIHCVCPEAVQTAMTRADSPTTAGEVGLDPQAVAATILDAVDRGDFLIVTHPRTIEFERRRSSDRPRWLAGMRRARATRFAATASIPQSSGD